MKTIFTKNYELSVNVGGPADSTRLAIIHPGFLETHEYPHMRAYVDLFASLGYYAIAYNSPGIWGSKIHEDSEYKGREYSMYRQVDAGVELCDKLITSNPLVKITGVGHSGGSRPPVFEAAVFKNFDSLIIDRGAYTWLRPSNEDDKKIKWEEEKVRKLKKPSPHGGPDVVFEVPYDYSYRAADYDIPQLMSMLEIEKLQIVGRWDKVVPSKESREDFEQACEPKELVAISADHYYLSLLNTMRNAVASKEYVPISKKANYSNPRVIDKNMKIVRNWLERKNLIPS